MLLENQVVLVTGGSRGIGKAVALACAREGAHVIINYAGNVKAAEETTKDKINVYVFTKDGCPYCEKAKTFLNSITDEYGKYFNLVVYEVYDAEWNANENLKNVMDTVAKEFGDKVNGVPYIVIGNEASWPGYQSAFDNDIKKAIKKAYENN